MDSIEQTTSPSTIEEPTSDDDPTGEASFMAASEADDTAPGVDFDTELLKMADRCFAHALDQFARSQEGCSAHEELRRLGMAHRLADLARRIGAERDHEASAQ